MNGRCRDSQGASWFRRCRSAAIIPRGTRGGTSQREALLMRELIAGIAEFREKLLPQYAERFRALASGQSPDTLMITCSDSRVVPDLLARIMHVRSFCATGTLCYQGVSHQVKGPIGT